MPPELCRGTPIVVDLDALMRETHAPIDLFRRAQAPANAIVVRETEGVAGLISALVRRSSKK
jgi:hypothetical protein